MTNYLIVLLSVSTLSFAFAWWRKRWECKELRLTANNLKFDFDKISKHQNDSKLYISLGYDICGQYKQYDIKTLAEWKYIDMEYSVLLGIKISRGINFNDTKQFVPVTKHNIVYKTN